MSTIIEEIIGGPHFATAYNGLGTGLTDIPRTGLVAGTANHVLVNDGSGVLSSTSVLNPARGGTGLDTSASTGLVRITTGTWSAGGTVVNADVSASAAIDFSKLQTGTANGVAVFNGSGVLTGATTVSTSRGGTGQDFSGIGAGPFVPTISSGVFSASLGYSTTNTANNLVQRDGSNAVFVSSVGSTSDLTLSPGSGNVLYGTATINQSPGAGSAIIQRTAAITTANATPTVLFTIPTSTGTNGTAYSFICHVSLGDATNGINTGLYEVLFKGKNLLGVVTVSGLLRKSRSVDGNFNATDITAGVSGTNILINATGRAATNINWVGRLTIVSRTF